MKNITRAVDRTSTLEPGHQLRSPGDRERQYRGTTCDGARGDAQLIFIVGGRREDAPAAQLLATGEAAAPPFYDDHPRVLEWVHPLRDNNRDLFGARRVRLQKVHGSELP